MDLFSYESHIDPRTVRARTLVVTLNGFADAGQAQRGLNRNLVDHLTGHQLGSFDVDSLIDYRDQRPAMVFDQDHFADYRPPVMALHSLLDEHGEPFLLLRGPEPSTRWEAVVNEVDRLVRAHEVQLVVMAGTIPMAAPHTRPLRTTKWASDPAMLVGNEPMFGSVMLPAAFPNLLGYRLGQKGHAVIGLATHVPHYLADVEYPDATLALIRGIGEVSGLHLPTHQVALAAGVARGQISAQIEASEELGEMISSLEEAYDQTPASRAIGSTAVPSADEIGAQVEDFLKGLGGDATPDAGGVESGPDEVPPPGADSPSSD